LKVLPPFNFLFLYILSVLLPLSGTAQISLPSPRDTLSLQSEFYKQSATWNWYNRLNLADSSGKYWNYSVSDVFQSNLIIPGVGKKQWKDENIFNGLFYAPVSAVTAGIYSKSWMQTDRQAAQDNRFGNHSIGIFTVWDQNQLLALRPYAGYQQSQNRKKIDWGYDLGLRANLINWKLGEYQSNFDGESNYDFYAKRQNYENKFHVGIKGDFTRYTSDSLLFSFSEMSKQYWVGDSIEQVKLFNRDLTNKLFYTFSPYDLLTVHTQLQSRNISYFNGRNIFFIDNIIRYVHFGERWNYMFGLRTSDEAQNNDGIQTDSRTLQTALNMRMAYRFSDDHYLDADFAYVKLQYDTPDSIVNNDDRDEQRFVFNVSYYKRLSPVLIMQWQAYSYFFHQIYIFREQSLNNSWNRIFKLNPRIMYKTNAFTNTLSTQVLANYTVYDFEDTLAQTRSFVFRKYTISDSLTLKLYAENYSGIFYRLELEDKGTFYESDFSQQLLQSYRSDFYNFFVYNDYFWFFNVRLGYTIYNRKEWRHLPEKRLNREISNRGPYLNISYHQTERLMFTANAAMLSLSDSRSKTTRYMTGYIRLNYLL